METSEPFLKPGVPANWPRFQPLRHGLLDHQLAHGLFDSLGGAASKARTQYAVAEHFPAVGPMRRVRWLVSLFSGIVVHKLFCFTGYLGVDAVADGDPGAFQPF